MTNILDAVHAIVKHGNTQIIEFYSGRNRANNMGQALENYIKDAFANTFNIEDEERRLEIYNSKYSWLGAQNSPPDIMIRGGDAIEVKKTQSTYSSLALNSSYPKANLNRTSPMITNECRSSENWTTKDIIYCIGCTSDRSIKSLWMIYGSIYAAKHETYQRIKNKISEGIRDIQDVVFSDTKELGRINKVDPLGITNLRVRGMWQIENPRRVFNYIHETRNNNFELVCIIPKEKYKSINKISKNRIEAIVDEGFSVKERKVKDPNNPANLLSCIVIKYIK